jgi:hypothetical protein
MGRASVGVSVQVEQLATAFRKRQLEFLRGGGENLAGLATGIE